MTEEKKKSSGRYVPKRYILVILGFLGMFNLYTMRVNLSMAMVAMVNSTERSVISNETSEIKGCAVLQELQEETSEVTFKGEQYNWDSKTQGMLLGALFYGYTVTQIPSGYLSEKFGAKWLFGGGVFMTSVLTLLSPISARMGTYVFLAVRILEGLAQGVAFPAITFLVSKWSPVLERSRLSTIIFMGTNTGNMLAMPITGWLSSLELFGGWPSSFYFFGAIGCIWFAFWALLVHETPSVHPTISKEELDYILLSNSNASQKKPPVPWKSIFTSLPMYAVLAANFGHLFGYTLFFSEMPTYLNTILRLNLKKDGAYSALPFIMQVFSAFFASYVADKLRSSGKLSITWIRKIMNSIGLVGPAFALLCVTKSGCQWELVICLLTVGMAFNGFVFSGFNVTHIDMSPQFSGTLYGITNTLGNLGSVILPAIVGAVMSKEATISNWNNVFYMTSAVYIGTAIFYLIFASAEQQPWARSLKEESENEKGCQLSS